MRGVEVFMLIFICILAAITVVIACVVAYKAYDARKHVVGVTDELQQQVDRLHKARRAVELAALPRWASSTREALVRGIFNNLRLAQRSLDEARAAKRLPSPTARQNIAAADAAIGKGDNALLKVVDDVIRGICTTGPRLMCFRDKVEKNIRLSCSVKDGDEELSLVSGLQRRMAWNLTEDRALKHPFATFALMVSHVGTISVVVTELGVARKWQNGLLRYRIEAALLRLEVVRQARAALGRIATFRVLRGECLEEAWNAVVTERGSLVSESGLHRTKMHLDDAARFLRYRSQPEARILEEVSSAEAMLMSFEAVLMEVLDPGNSAEDEYQRSFTDAKFDWRRDVQRTGSPVGSRSRAA